MIDVVICDTNAAIHLAIICPDILKAPPMECKILLHLNVKAELNKLIQDTGKKARLGTILDFLLKQVPTDTSKALPKKDEEIRMHKRIQQIESGLPPGVLSSGSSHQDRCFLILAKKHGARLLTNEKTLYALGCAFLPEQTWRTSDAITRLLELGTVDLALIKTGVALLPKYNETLHVDCVKKLKSLGV